MQSEQTQFSMSTILIRSAHGSMLEKLTSQLVWAAPAPVSTSQLVWAAHVVAT